ncbi:MAG: hypothetical protein ACRDBG_25365 [Waterburya sp.]
MLAEKHREYFLECYSMTDLEMVNPLNSNTLSPYTFAACQGIAYSISAERGLPVIVRLWTCDHDLEELLGVQFTDEELERINEEQEDRVTFYFVDASRM